MSLLSKLSVSQFQRIVSIEASTIYSIADKKVGVVAIADNVAINEVMQRSVLEVNKRYDAIQQASQELPSLQAKRTIRVGAKWYRFEWFIDEITAGQLVELFSYDMTSDATVIENLHLILATLSRECRFGKYWPKAYDGKGHSKRAEVMRQMMMGDVWGYAAFFLQLSEPLLMIMQKSLTAQTKNLTTDKG
jgi:hypothetical protein